MSPVPDILVQHFANTPAPQCDMAQMRGGFSLRYNAPADDNSTTVGAAGAVPARISRTGLTAVRITSKSRLAPLAVATFALLSIAAGARAQIAFVPPNDPTGAVFTTNANDSWSGSRGVVFQATSTQTINSISLYQNLTGITVNYEVDQTTSASGNIGAGKTVLRSGNGVFTTSGLQFITFSIVPLQLIAGNFYQIRFDFTGNSNQNFFYNNNNVVFSQPGFSQIDGTQGDDTANSVMPSIQLGPASAPVALNATIPTLSPLLLGTLALLLAGASGLALRRRLRIPR